MRRRPQTLTMLSLLAIRHSCWPPAAHRPAARRLATGRATATVGAQPAARPSRWRQLLAGTPTIPAGDTVTFTDTDGPHRHRGPGRHPVDDPIVDEDGGSDIEVTFDEPGRTTSRARSTRR